MSIYRCEQESLRALDAPAILWWDFSRFVILGKTSDDAKFKILDPDEGTSLVTLDDMAPRYSGVAATLAPAFQLTHP
jgi:ABC-type bacteriocin/lantibiotic exporter with double-glycine peptidase domain